MFFRDLPSAFLTPKKVTYSTARGANPLPGGVPAFFLVGVGAPDLLDVAVQVLHLLPRHARLVQFHPAVQQVPEDLAGLGMRLLQAGGRLVDHRDRHGIPPFSGFDVPGSIPSPALALPRGVYRRVPPWPPRALEGAGLAFLFADHAEVA